MSRSYQEERDIIDRDFLGDADDYRFAASPHPRTPPMDGPEAFRRPARRTKSVAEWAEQVLYTHRAASEARSHAVKRPGSDVLWRAYEAREMEFLEAVMEMQRAATEGRWRG